MRKMETELVYASADMGEVTISHDAARSARPWIVRVKGEELTSVWSYAEAVGAAVEELGFQLEQDRKERSR